MIALNLNEKKSNSPEVCSLYTYFQDKYRDESENFLPLKSYPDYDWKVVKSAEGYIKYS